MIHKRKYKKRARAILRSLFFMSMLAAVICFSLVFISLIERQRQNIDNEKLLKERKYYELQNERRIEKTIDNPTINDTEKPKDISSSLADELEKERKLVLEQEKEEEVKRNIREWYKTKQKEMPDLKGLIVLKWKEKKEEKKRETFLFSRENDHLYYMNHDRYEKYSRNGEAGILKTDEGFNTIVWDHNFIDGTRFSFMQDIPDDKELLDSLEVSLELADGTRKDYEVVSARYETGSAFFKTSFSSEEKLKEYFKEHLQIDYKEDIKEILTIFTCHSVDGSVKSVVYCIPKIDKER